MLAALSRSAIAMAAVLAALYVLICVRLSLTMRALGRGPIRWFFVTLFLTGIPAVVVFWLDRMKGLREQQRGRFRHIVGRRGRPSGPDSSKAICPHCGQIIVNDQGRPDTGARTCPHCSMALGEERHA